jgi:mono/diheme cytochrome c family protein
MKLNHDRSLAAIYGATAMLLLAGAGALLFSHPAAATAQFAAATGKSCGDCHTAAAGGGPLTPYGEKFKANGDKVPK